MIDAVEEDREALESLKETDLPAAVIAEALLDAADTEG